MPRGICLAFFTVPSFHNSLISRTSIKTHSSFSCIDLTVLASKVFIDLFASTTKSWDDFIFMVLNIKLNERN